MAFNYGGRAEILDAARRFEGSTEEEFRQCLYAPEMHDPDLIIRTSGERRLSNYLLWQSAYSELIFRDELWPDFTRDGARRVAGRVLRAPPALRRTLSGAMAERRAHVRRRLAGSGARLSHASSAPPGDRPPGGPCPGGSSARRGPSASGPATGGQRSDLNARADRRRAGDRRRAVPRDRGRAGVRARAVRARLHLHARAVRDVRPRAPGPSGRLHRARRPAGGGAVRRPVPGPARRGRGAADAVRADAAAAAAERRGDGGDAARDLLDRLRARPRGAAARAAARAGDRDRRARRHVPRRHRRLPRRPAVRQAPAGAARSPRTRRSRAW